MNSAVGNSGRFGIRRTACFAAAVMLAAPAAWAQTGRSAAPAAQTFVLRDPRGVSLGKPAAPPSVEHGYAFDVVPEIYSEPIDLDAIRREDEERARVDKVLRYGVGLDLRVLPEHGAWLALPDGGLAWAADVVASGAYGVRVHLVGLELPVGALAAVYDPAGASPRVWRYEERGPLGDGTVWVPTLFNERVRVEVYVPADAAKEGGPIGFEVDGIQHVYRDPAQASWENEGNCHNDVTCYPDWADTARACAGIGVVNSNALYCSGQMLNTVINDQTPYWLTAAHCLNSNSEASSAEIYWLYQTAECNGSPPALSSVPQSSPCTLVKTGSSSDYTLLMVEGTIPSGLAWAGWTSATVPNGTASACIHHPDGAYKRISFGTKSSTTNCGGANHVRMNWTDGPTEPGSSGSGAFRGDTQQLFGQLHCGPSACGNETNDDYGDFTKTYPNISSYLDGGSDDTLEDNDSCATALALSPGSYSNLIVKSTDEDWYRITLINGQQLTASLTFTHANGDIDAELFDACGGSPVASNHGNQNNLTLTYTNNAATADFLLRVYLDADTRNGYSMTISLSCSTPVAPYGLSATDGSYCNRVTVAWSAGAGDSSFSVWRNTTSNSGSAVQIATTASTTYDDLSAAPGTTYWYWVKGLNACGNSSGFSNGDSGFVPAAPGAPAGVSASDATYCDKVRISWNSVAGATGYQVWRNTVNNSATAAQIATDNASPYDDASAATGATYFYWVKATNACSAGPFSSSDGGSTSFPPVITGQPQSQSVSAGDPVTFSVSATNPTPPTTYQWRRNGANIAGATAATYNIAAAAPSDAGTYDVVVTGGCGSTVSAEAVLAVSGGCVACDVNCDGSVNGGDISAFVDALGGVLNGCSPCQADANGDGSVNGLDIADFVACLTP